MQVPEFVMAIVWFVLGAGVLACVGWLASTLLRIRRALDESVELLIWLKREHQRDDLVGLLKEISRIARGTMATMRWLAKQKTGDDPPPDTGD